MRTDTWTKQLTFDQLLSEEAPKLLHLAFLLTGDREAGELALLRSVESLDLTRASDKKRRWKTAVIADSLDLVALQLSASVKTAEACLLKQCKESFDLPSPEWSVAHNIEDEHLEACLLMLDMFPRWLVVLRTFCKFSLCQISLFLQVDPDLVNVTHRRALSELTRSLAIVRGWVPGGMQNRISDEKQTWMAL